jgi:two-component system response regulator DevR
VRSVLLTSFDEDHAAAAAVIAGAYGYLIKEVKVVDLSAALQRVAEGDRVFDSEVAERALDALRRDVLAEPGSVPLTPRQVAVRDLLLEGRSDAEIAARLEVGEKTVRIYVAEVLTKVLSNM